jgi:hypothetical protein
VTVTAASATAAPDESLTVPLMAPSVVDCALRLAPVASVSISTTSHVEKVRGSFLETPIGSSSSKPAKRLKHTVRGVRGRGVAMKAARIALYKVSAARRTWLPISVTQSKHGGKEDSCAKGIARPLLFVPRLAKAVQCRELSLQIFHSRERKKNKR